MRKILIFFLLVNFSGFAQNKEYSKMNKEELIEKIKSMDLKNIKNQETLKIYSERESKATKIYTTELSKLKKIIKETNTIFLREIFNDKYMSNKEYFKNTDLVNDDNRIKFENSNILINSILADEFSTKIEKEISHNALNFNENYLALFKIRETVLNQKCDEIKVKAAMLEIDSLPLLNKEFKLNTSKDKIRHYLANYMTKTCELKLILEKLNKNPYQNPTFKREYTKLENDENFKVYPYLVKVIQKAKVDSNDYSENDLQPCQEKEIESNKK